MFRKITLSVLFVLIIIVFSSHYSYAAGCTVRIKATNSYPSGPVAYRIYLSGGNANSKVKIKNGFWKYVWQPYDEKIVSNDSTETFIFNSDFGCNKKRRYKFHINCYKPDWQKKVDFYYPSSKGWTEETTINLGDLYVKYCR